MRKFFHADVTVPAKSSHTGEARTIRISIIITGANSLEITQKAADVGFATGLLLIGGDN